jgi:drug/metabolite transporter (DMT)-like permease
MTTLDDPLAHTRRRRLQADLVLLLVALIWGSAFVAQRMAAGDIGVYLFNGVRFLLAAAVLTPLAWSRVLNGTSPPGLKRGNILGVVLAGLVMVAGSALQQAGMRTTTAGNAGFITGLYVVLIPIMLSIFWRRRPRPLIWAAALLAAVGMYLLSIAGKMQVNPGDVLELIGAFFWALHVIIISYMVQRMDVLRFAAGQYLVCGVVNMALAFRFETVAFSVLAANLGAILYTGLISVGLGYTLQAVAQRVAPPADAAILLSGEAVFAALSGWIFLGEALTPLQLLGCGIMLSGMLLAQSDLWLKPAVMEN